MTLYYNTVAIVNLCSLSRVTLNGLLKSTVKEETQVLFGLFSSQARTGLDWNGAGIEA